ncbi:DUF3460 family protein [Niveibacterium sp. SC-1]|uniref:DUF3460 family protein n=1 Tax=Niveibacterium sp. SC-1 TaxID=3135646 RepID=UPI00311D800B
MAQYESAHTQFMRQYMAEHPEQVEEQKKGRALWWDKPQDLQTTEANAESTVAQKSYYYQTEV